MKIVADANIEYYIVMHLRKAGYKVIWINELEQAIQDPVVLKIAQDNQALLLTSDKDFGSLIFEQNFPLGYGIVLLRLDGVTREKILTTITTFVENNKFNLENTFTVITPNKIRTQLLG